MDAVIIDNVPEVSTQNQVGSGDGGGGDVECIGYAGTFHDVRLQIRLSQCHRLHTG